MANKPEQILHTWMDAVNRKDLDTLLSLYSDTAVLIPTFSNKLLTTPADIKDYFLKLANRDTLGVSLHSKTLKIQNIMETGFALSGIYLWQLTVDGEPFSFEARFSFLVDTSKQKPILHHHSSQIPRML